MGVLARAIRDGDVPALTQLIGRRLGGDQLDSPFSEALGNTPRNILIELYRHEVNRPTIDLSLRDLLDGRVVAQLDCIEQDPERMDCALWLLELFAFLHEIKFTAVQASLRAVSLRVALLDIKHPAILAIQVASLQAYAASGINPQQLVSFIGPALQNLDAAQDYSYALSGSAPREFLRDLAPQILTRFAGIPVQDQEKLEFLTDTVFNAISALQSEHNGPIDQVIGDFLRHAAGMAIHPAGSAIRARICAALSRSNLKIEILQKFEQSYWDVYPPIDIYKNNQLAVARDSLHRRIQRHSNLKFSAGRSITINPLPYAEAAYFRVFEAAMKIGYDVEVIFQQVEYGNVLASLVDGRINLAAHNPSIFTQYPRPKENNPLLQSKPLIEFRGYDALASRTCLQNMVRAKELSNAAQELAGQLLDGDDLVQMVATTDTQPSTQKVTSIRPKTKLETAISELVAKGGLAYLKNTDTESVACGLFGKQPSKFIYDLDPDEGLERLLDGDVCFYVGGALQAKYATGVCPNRVFAVGTISRGTTLHFYTMENRYKESTELFDNCVRAWASVKLLWDALENPQLASAPQRHLLELLREGIVLDINRDRSLRNGFASSFQDLAELLHDHDKLCDLGEGDGQLFKEEKNPEITFYGVERTAKLR